jgi:hypothetical protein
MTPDDVTTGTPSTPITAADALARAAAGELLDKHDLMAIFHLRRSAFDNYRRRGEFDRFVVLKPIGARCYSGTLVDRYVRGEAEYVPSFAAKRGRR